MTYHWKGLNKAYNFTLDFTSIKGLNNKLWPSKVPKVPISGISRLPTWESQDKWHVTIMSNHWEYYKGDGGFPQFKTWWALWVRVCPWLVYASKVPQLHTKQLLVWFLQVCVNNGFTCHSAYFPSMSSSTPFYPQNVVS
jgi:hypothetical protein